MGGGGGAYHLDAGDKVVQPQTEFLPLLPEACLDPGAGAGGRGVTSPCWASPVHTPSGCSAAFDSLRAGLRLAFGDVCLIVNLGECSGLQPAC